MSADLFDNIIKLYNTLTNSEMVIADYILNNKNNIHEFTVHGLARQCGVSAATVTRFCHSLGYEGFGEFKFDIAQSIFLQRSAKKEELDTPDLYEQVYPEDSLEQKCKKLCNINKQALDQTLEMLDISAVRTAVALLLKANHVYCFGQGNSSIAAMDAYGRFISVTSKFHWVPDAHLQADTAATLKKNDVVLYFSFSGNTRELSEIGKLMKKGEGKLILVTRFPNSPGAAFADVLLLCGANESVKQQGSVAVKISQLFIIDALYNEYCALDMEKTKENRQKTLAATSGMML